MTDPHDPFAAPGDQPSQPPVPPPFSTPPTPPPAYGTPPPPPGYGAAPAYGSPPPAYGAPPVPYGGAQLAGWGSRVGAGLLDGLVFAVPYFVGIILGAAVGGGLGGLLTFLGVVGGIAAAVWNLVRQGSTGQSIGKQQVGLRLLRESDGQVVGGGMSVLRAVLHVVDGMPCYLGYLWPLWDAKRQTFADKILGTLVVKA